MHKVFIPRETIEPLINQGMSVRAIASKLGVKRGTLRKRMAEFGLRSTARPAHSEETKARLSVLAKERIKNHPERFHKLCQSRGKSRPCEVVKEWLKSQSIPFIEEFQPMLDKGRFFSIDIAFPDKKIGIEINGNQHYNKDGSLADYYQKRHDLIEAEGWVLYELHYSTCFHIDAISKLVPQILNSAARVEFDYYSYVKPRAEKKPRPSDLDPDWRRKQRLKSRRYTQPSKEELQKLVWEKPVTAIAKGIGCSGNSVKKWCARYGIKTPSVGYWARRAAGYSHEDSLVSQARPKGNPKVITPEIETRIVSMRDVDNLGWAEIANAIGFERRAVARTYYRATGHPFKKG